MPTIGGVTYTELNDGSGQGDYDLTPKSQSISATKVFLIAFGDLNTFINAVKYTQHPVYLYSYAMKFHVDPYGKPTAENTWDHAKVTVTYNNLPYNTTDFKEVAYASTAEVASVDKNAVEFNSGSSPADKKVNESPQVVIGTIDVKITLHNQASFSAQSAADALKGQINTAAFSPESGVSYAADTVLYKGYDATSKYSIGGTPVHEITHNFTVAPRDWRDRFNPVTGTWDKVVAKAGGGNLYTEGDFSTLGIP